MADLESITAKLKESGQEHCLDHYSSLSADAQQELLATLHGMDLKEIRRIFNASMNSLENKPAAPQPVTDVQTTELTSQQKQQWTDIGLQLLRDRMVGILLLAGGQGTRLGSSDPKGCYNVNLPSGKSLFQLQAERVRRLQDMTGGAKPGQGLRWYIMTSKFTHEPTVEYLKKNKFFGLEEEQIMFFQQAFLPCMDQQGKIIMESEGKIAEAPDGNGGIYIALETSGALKDMKDRGIECVDCYCVDNVLARLGSPLFLGYCKARGADAGARVVSKREATEKVGVFAKSGSGVQVIEYSELGDQQAAATDPTTGRLVYNWSNICMHYFTVQWLDQVTQVLRSEGKYHVAKKQIPSMGTKVPGVKLELFIFDTFPQAQNFALFEVERDQEFSPLKNAPGSGQDCPETCRAAVLAQGGKWVKEAGGVVGEEGCEVSPLLSHAGEGLGAVKGKSVGLEGP